MPKSKFAKAKVIKCNICKRYKLIYDKTMGQLTKKRVICKSCGGTV